MKQLFFVTGNTSKFYDLKRYFNQLDPTIELLMEPLDVPEIQTLDMEKVARQKAEYAWGILKKPLIIDDGGIFIKRYNKFPGTLSRYVVEGIGLEGIWLLAQDDPRTDFTCYLAYKDNDQTSILAKGTTTGRIIKPISPIENPQFPYTQVFVPDGSDKTYAELRASQQADSFSHRRKAVADLLEQISADCYCWLSH